MTLTEAEKQNFKAVYLSGAAMQTICKQLQITEREVNEIAYDLGLLERLQFRWNEEKEAYLKDMINYGYSWGDIAKHLGCTKETARRKKNELFPVKNYWDQPGKVVELKELLEEGYSASQIARVMGGGISRNAIIGKVTRSGLSFKKTKKRKANSTERLPRKISARKFNYPQNPVKTKEEENARRSKVFELQPGEEYVSLVDHKDSQCRCVKEIDGKFVGFCAKQAEEGSSYCKEHDEIFNRINPYEEGSFKKGQAA